MSPTQEALKRIERTCGEFRQALEQDIPKSERDRYMTILTTNMRDVERWLTEAPVLEEPIVDELGEVMEPDGDD